jgi:hypothetical protein
MMACTAWHGPKLWAAVRQCVGAAQPHANCSTLACSVQGPLSLPEANARVLAAVQGDALHSIGVQTAKAQQLGQAWL